MSIVNLFLSFRGRIGRPQFWLGFILIIVVQTVIEVVLGVPLSTDPTGWRLRIIAFIIGLVFMYPMMAIAVKRMRDRRDRLSYIWLLVAAYVIALLGDLTGYFDQNAQPNIVTWAVLLVVSIVLLGFLIDLGFRRGRTAS
ncbi:MAG TPA: DUF805 domain-containing protein [Stellaceae bacterium]